jgi:hypothetical protein
MADRIADDFAEIARRQKLMAAGENTFDTAKHCKHCSNLGWVNVTLKNGGFAYEPCVMCGNPEDKPSPYYWSLGGIGGP